MKGKKVKKMMDFAILAAALVVTILGPYFYPNSALAVNEVVVGGVLPLTGGVAAWGIRNDWGHRYVFDIINAQGGIKSLGGAKIKYITLDTESKPEIAQLQAEKIAAGNVACILGATQSAASLVVSQVAERKEIPYITTTDLDPLITERGFKYVFRPAAIMGDIAKTILVFANIMNKTSGTNFKKVGVLCEDSVVGDSCAKALEKYTKEMNYTLVDVVKYNAATTKDFTGVLLRYKVKGVELIAGHNKPADTIQIVRNCKEVGFNPAMIGGVSGGWTAPELLGSLGPLAEGICIASSESPNPALGKFPEIVKWYEKEHNEPLASATFVNGISGAWLIYLALEKCGSNDPKIIAKTLRTLDVKYGDGYYFMLDGCKFDEKGDNTRASATVFQVQNNTRKTVYPLELATTKTIWPRPKFK